MLCKGWRYFFMVIISTISVIIYIIRKRGCKKTRFFYTPFSGDRKKCFRTDKLSQQSPYMGFVGLPEGVRGYVERRSLFVAKRLKNEEKSNKIRFFNKNRDL